MNPLKSLENIVKVRDELNEVQRKVEHLQKTLDLAAHEIIEFLKMKKIIESK